VAAEGRKQLSDWLRKGQLNEALLLSVRDVVKPDVYERFSGYLKKPAEQSKRWELSKDIIKGISQVKADIDESNPAEIEQDIDELASIGTPEIMEEAESYYAQLQNAINEPADSPLKRPDNKAIINIFDDFMELDWEATLGEKPEEKDVEEFMKNELLFELKKQTKLEELQRRIKEKPDATYKEKLEWIKELAPERKEIMLNWFERLMLPKDRSFSGLREGRGMWGSVSSEEERLAYKRKQTGVAPEEEFESIKMQTAPFMEFDDVWGSMTDEQKKSIWDNQKDVQRALDNGYSIEEIMESL